MCMNVCDMICKAQARKQDRVSSADGAAVAAHARPEQGGAHPKLRVQGSGSREPGGQLLLLYYSQACS